MTMVINAADDDLPFCHFPLNDINVSGHEPEFLGLNRIRFNDTCPSNRNSLQKSFSEKGI